MNRTMIFLLIFNLFMNQLLKAQIQCKFFVNAYSNQVVNISKNSFFIYHEVNLRHAFKIDSFIVKGKSVYVSNRVGLFEVFDFKKFQKKDTFIVKDNFFISDLIIDFELDLIPDTLFEYKKVKIFRFKVYKQVFKDSMDVVLREYKEVFDTCDFVVGYGYIKNIMDYKGIPDLRPILECDNKYLRAVYKMQKRLDVN